LTSRLSESQIKEDQERQEEIPIKKILVPIDGSNYFMRAAKYAIEISKLQKAQIVCIYVIAKLPYGYECVGSVIEECFKDIKNQSQSWFNQIIKMAENNGIKDVKTDILVNVLSISDALIYYAKDNSIDLIVIGTRGITGIERFLVGSVANSVVKHAHCPVLVVT
jgi:nucleotide-binding universal stress UspA family protein